MPKNLVLRELREALGLNQSEFARRVGPPVYQSTVSTAEAGKERLTDTQALKITDSFRPTMNRLAINTEDLLRGTRLRIWPESTSLAASKPDSGEPKSGPQAPADAKGVS